MRRKGCGLCAAYALDPLLRSLSFELFVTVWNTSCWSFRKHREDALASQLTDVVLPPTYTP
eukprot:6474468-Amphidinium_carterae.1